MAASRYFLLPSTMEIASCVLFSPLYISNSFIRYYDIKIYINFVIISSCPCRINVSAMLYTALTFFQHVRDDMWDPHFCMHAHCTVYVCIILCIIACHIATVVTTRLLLVVIHKIHNNNIIIIFITNGEIVKHVQAFIKLWMLWITKCVKPIKINFSMFWFNESVRISNDFPCIPVLSI